MLPTHYIFNHIPQAGGARSQTLPRARSDEPDSAGRPSVEQLPCGILRVVRTFLVVHFVTAALSEPRKLGFHDHWIDYAAAFEVTPPRAASTYLRGMIRHDFRSTVDRDRQLGDEFSNSRSRERKGDLRRTGIPAISA